MTKPDDASAQQSLGKLDYIVSAKRCERHAKSAVNTSPAAMSPVMRLAITALMLLAPAVVFAADIPQRAEDVTPLSAGAELPDVPLQTVQGRETTSRAALNGEPAVLVFFRGGWCPYCNRHLGNLRKIEAEVQALGYQLIAISPDSPASLRAGLEAHKAEYTLLSDSSAAFIRALGIAFEVDAETREKYRGYGIDLEQASGQDHHLLPVPAVYVVNRDGVIQYRYANPDYKVRLDNQALLEQLRSAR